MNKEKHSCCAVSQSKTTSVCKECGNRGNPVKEITLKNIVKEKRLVSIKSFEGFYFCETPKCDVVYFNNEQNIYLYKKDVKVRVGIKETENPIPVCYCFDWTQEKIFNQIKQKGFSTAVEEISAKVKAGECACEIKNPSGRCCLGEVNKVVKKGMELYGKDNEMVEVRIPCKGMACTGCEFNVENAVKKLNSIIQVKADHRKGECYVKFEKGKVTIEDIV